MTFGNEDLGAHSAALNGGQNIGSVTVTGNFMNSDIAASINPGAGYVFGDSTITSTTGNDSFTGAGGTIGAVKISTGLQEASPFRMAPSLTASRPRPLPTEPHR